MCNCIYPEQSFKQFADEVSDARRAGDIDNSLKLIADTMKLFGNSAYGKCIANKERFKRQVMLITILSVIKLIIHILQI